MQQDEAYDQKDRTLQQEKRNLGAADLDVRCLYLNVHEISYQSGLGMCIASCTKNGALNNAIIHYYNKKVNYHEHANRVM